MGYDPLLRQVRRKDKGAVGTVTSVSGGTGITVTPSPIVGAGTVALTNQIVAGGPIGDATHVAQITWNAQGQLKVVASVLIAAAGASGFEPFLLMGA